jgi:hypothetical protein
MTDALCEVTLKSAMAYKGNGTDLWARAIRGAIEEGM